MTEYVLIATNMGEAFAHAGHGCRDIILTDKPHPTRGKHFLVDEIRITDTALDEPTFPATLAAVIDAFPPIKPPTIQPIFRGIIHHTPEGDADRTPCCNNPVTSHPNTDRVTNIPTLVTCRRYSTRLEDQTGLDLLPWQRDYIDHLIAAGGLT